MRLGLVAFTYDYNLDLGLGLGHNISLWCDLKLILMHNGIIGLEGYTTIAT